MTFRKINTTVAIVIALVCAGNPAFALTDTFSIATPFARLASNLSIVQRMDELSRPSVPAEAESLVYQFGLADRVDLGTMLCDADLVHSRAYESGFSTNIQSTELKRAYGHTCTLYYGSAEARSEASRFATSFVKLTLQRGEPAVGLALQALDEIYTQDAVDEARRIVAHLKLDGNAQQAMMYCSADLSQTLGYRANFVGSIDDERLQSGFRDICTLLYGTQLSRKAALALVYPMARLADSLGCPVIKQAIEDLMELTEPQPDSIQ